MKKNILILGSSSALGKAVLDQLCVLPNIEITAFDRGNKDVIYPNFVKHIIGDATDYNDLKEALVGIDIVFSTLGPFEMEKFATPLVKAMTELNIQRLFWTTQYQILDSEVSKENLDLALDFGFSEAVELTYVETQKAGAEIIRNSSLNYTLLMLHFFYYDNRLQQTVLNFQQEPIEGGPISVGTLAKMISEMIYHEELYEQRFIKISAK